MHRKLMLDWVHSANFGVTKTLYKLFWPTFNFVDYLGRGIAETAAKKRA